MVASLARCLGESPLEAAWRAGQGKRRTRGQATEHTRREGDWIPRAALGSLGDMEGLTGSGGAAGEGRMMLRFPVTNAEKHSGAQ